MIRSCRNMDWLVLTKRSERIARCLPKDWGTGWVHVWLGVSVENQKWIKRIEDLLAVPASIRFVSAEPLLGPINFRPYMDRLDWIITGCERAAVKKRRPMDIDWVRDIHNQCDAAKKAFFFKQYYEGTKLVYDGVLDGIVRQEWPISQATLQEVNS